MKYNIITILGPTATGKTSLAVKLALYFDGEIISADSRQVYRGMDIGTGKDLNEYSAPDKNIPYHLIDIIEPDEEFNLYEFQKLFYRAFNLCINNGKIPFLVGGTGLFIHSILKDYKLKYADFTRQNEYEHLSDKELKKLLLKLNPNLHNTTDLINRDRIIKAIIVAEGKDERNIQREKVTSINIGIYPGREIIKKRITARLKSRLSSGMIDEVRELLDRGITHEKLEFFGLEYKYISLYLRGELNMNDMFQKLNSAIHKFAKRQMTWFRKMEREGIAINWIEGPNFDEAKKIIESNYFVK